MKKSIVVAVTVLVAGGLLAGCAGAEVGVESATDAGGVGEVSQQSGSDQPTAADAAPRGFEFASGFLEFGDFDPYAIGDDGFKPCTEISEEEFATAGFEDMWFENDGAGVLARGMASCFFAGDLPDGVLHGFSNGKLNRSIAAERGLLVREHTSSLLPELYAVAPRGGNDGMCFIQIDTVRGSFGTQAGGSPNRTTTDEACKLAIKDLETLYSHFGK